ncbi:hypothetical protein QBC37DRAFT_385099 [Rhypophila decipiens]|uniref:Uncharacterized protein n=1 Tax=Rhypophila decipiens TaxID=261697 RepID=A0AAN6YFP8_9PEZI|nr:hypothetical protein QBC37DRAFT_385099 [Rhypophila decipiens]
MAQHSHDMDSVVHGRESNPQQPTAQAQPTPQNSWWQRSSHGSFPSGPDSPPGPYSSRIHGNTWPSAQSSSHTTVISSEEAVGGSPGYHQSLPRPSTFHLGQRETKVIETAVAELSESSSATCVSNRQEEEKKEVISKHRGVALLRSFIHIIPIFTAAIVIFFNASEYYIGGELEGNTDQDTEKLAALQFAAKVHELFMITSIGYLVVTYIKREMISNEGIPFGAVFSPTQFQNISFLWSAAMWGIIFSKWKHTGRKLFIISLIFVCTILGLAVGPSTANLMRPRLDRWPAGGTTLWINASLDELYPTVVRPSDSIAHCLVDTGDLACPAGNWQTLNQLFFSYWPQLTNMQTVPQYFSIPSRFSTMTMHIKSRRSDHEDAVKPIWSGAYTIATVALAPLADAVVEMVRLWEYAARYSERRIRFRQDTYFDMGAKQPVVFARCLRSHDRAEILFPALGGMDKVDGLNETQNATLHETINLTDESVTAELSALLSPDQLPSFIWVDDEDIINATSGSIAVIMTNPDGSDGQGEFFPCTVLAAWGDGYLTSRLGLTKVSNGTTAKFETQGPFNPSWPPVKIQADWARYLNPSTPSLSNSSSSSSALANILESSGLWHPPSSTTGPAPFGFGEIIVENALTLLMASGLSRYAYTASLRLDLLKGPVDPTNLWDGGTWASELLPNSKFGDMGPAGEAFNPPTEEELSAGSSSSFGLRIEVLGYAYSMQKGMTQMVSAMVLAVYIFLMVLHVLFTLSTGWSSGSWGSPPEVAALALRSRIPGPGGEGSEDGDGLFKNTGAGIDKVRVYEEKCCVRVVGGGGGDRHGDGTGDGRRGHGHLEMVFRDREGEKDQMGRVEENVSYG